MSSKHKVKHHPYCLNCHYPLAEFDKMCSQCGQKPTDGKTTMHDLLHEFIHTLFHLDGKFFWTLKHLFVPSRLTLEFFKGHHKRYAHPIQLFIVIGAFAFAMLTSSASKLEEKFAQSIDQQKNKVNRNKFLIELDSVSKALLPTHSGNTAVSLRDSIMLNMIYPQGFEKTKEEIYAEIDKVLDIELKKKKNRIVFKFDKDTSSYDKFKDSLLTALMDETSLNNKEKENQERISDSLNGENHNLKDFKRGFQYGFTNDLRDKLRSQILALKKNNGNLKDLIKVQEDSTNLMSINFTDKEKITVPMSEVYDLTPDSIIAKYNIKDFIDKIQVKQTVKAIKEGNNLVHFVLSKLFWMTFALIPVLALFFMLLYFRQKRFYVEHFVFLIHANTTLFAGLAITIFISSYWQKIVAVFFVWAMIHFFLALKFYYNQGWGKTFFKFFLISNFYVVFALIFFTITAILGFIFF
jgi:hypothetical protein